MAWNNERPVPVSAHDRIYVESGAAQPPTVGVRTSGLRIREPTTVIT